MEVDLSDDVSCECVEKFCCLVDMLNGESGTESALIARGR